MACEIETGEPPEKRLGIVGTHSRVRSLLPIHVSEVGLPNVELRSFSRGPSSHTDPDESDLFFASKASLIGGSDEQTKDWPRS